MPQATGIVPKTLDFDGRTHRYAVFVPTNYAPERAWPAMLYMHGMGERGLDGDIHTHHGLGKAIREHADRFTCIVVMPQCPPDSLWEARTLDFALATLDAAEAEYRLDPDRVVLTGLSMGGYGTWTLGASHANRFAAFVPICGGGDPADAPLLARRPIWCFHGDADPVVPVQRSRGPECRDASVTD